MKKKKEKSFAWWHKKAWEVFSKYIRTRDRGICYTCGKFAEGSGYHAGHYAPQSTSNMEARFNPDFVKGQCYACNIHRSGNHIEYRKRLVEENGEGHVKNFENTYKRVPTGRKWSIADYERVINNYL